MAAVDPGDANTLSGSATSDDQANPRFLRRFIVPIRVVPQIRKRLPRCHPPMLLRSVLSAVRRAPASFASGARRAPALSAPAVAVAVGSLWDRCGVAVAQRRSFAIEHRAERGASHETKPPADFEAEVQKLLKHVAKGLENMKDSNEMFDVHVSKDGLKLNTGSSGVFTLRVNREAGLVELHSPVTSGHAYKFNAENGWWEEVQDGHKLLELLTRDLIQACRGYPTF